MLTTREAADRLGIQARSVVQLIRRGRLKAEKRGRDYLIEAAEVKRYEQERQPAHRPKKIALTRDTGAQSGADTRSEQG
jgi:excisionase family DNA binding protein